jgi:hypothetical protein
MTRLKITVRTNNINSGVRFDATRDPIARAIKQVTGMRCATTESAIEMADGTRYRMTDRARRFISKFDHQGRKAVKPQTFLFTKIA